MPLRGRAAEGSAVWGPGVGQSLISVCLSGLLLQEWYEEHSRKEESQTPLQEPASACTSSLKPPSLRQRSQTVI